MPSFLYDYISQALTRFRDLTSTQRPLDMANTPKKINPQSASPFFNRIPPEIRNHIFQLALTAYEDPKRKYKRYAYYYRPGYTCVHKIDTALLLSCRLVYTETARLPASINELTAWCYRQPPIRQEYEPAPMALEARRRQELRKVHVFAQQFWLELEQHGFAQFLDLWERSHPTNLTITLRHTDWWWWEEEAPLALDPKQRGRPSAARCSRSSDPFDPVSWGAQFRRVSGLQVLRMELETVEAKKDELDAIAKRAREWKFPLGDGNTLVIDESKTKRTGWIGRKLDEDLGTWGQSDGLSLDGEDGSDEDVTEDDPIDGSSLPEDLALTPPQPTDADLATYFPSDSQLQDAAEASPGKPRSSAKERLQAAGVIFNNTDHVRGLPEHLTSTYYVVTLTWRARRL
ncbi:MAG: hypothetical protein Q9170_003700 [Blastenia crenularia]